MYTQSTHTHTESQGTNGFRPITIFQMSPNRSFLAKLFILAMLVTVGNSSECKCSPACTELLPGWVAALDVNESTGKSQPVYEQDENRIFMRDEDGKPKRLYRKYKLKSDGTPDVTVLSHRTTQWLEQTYDKPSQPHRCGKTLKFPDNDFVEIRLPEHPVVQKRVKRSWFNKTRAYYLEEATGKLWRTKLNPKSASIILIKSMEMKNATFREKKFKFRECTRKRWLEIFDNRTKKAFDVIRVFEDKGAEYLDDLTEKFVFLKDIACKSAEYRCWDSWSQGELFGFVHSGTKVRIRGLHDTQYDGQEATLDKYYPKEKRWVVTLDTTNKQIAVTRSNFLITLTLNKGSRVRIQGLQTLGLTQYNGKEATVDHYNFQRDRWYVTLHTMDNKQIGVKPVNLLVLPFTIPAVAQATLPPGWFSGVDSASGKPFYTNSNDPRNLGKHPTMWVSQWEYPPLHRQRSYSETPGELLIVPTPGEPKDKTGHRPQSASASLHQPGHSRPTAASATNVSAFHGQQRTSVTPGGPDHPDEPSFEDSVGGEPSYTAEGTLVVPTPTGEPDRTARHRSQRAPASLHQRGRQNVTCNSDKTPVSSLSDTFSPPVPAMDSPSLSMQLPDIIVKPLEPPEIPEAKMTDIIVPLESAEIPKVKIPEPFVKLLKPAEIPEMKMPELPIVETASTGKPDDKANNHDGKPGSFLSDNRGPPVQVKSDVLKSTSTALPTESCIPKAIEFGQLGMNLSQQRDGVRNEQRSKSESKPNLKHRSNPAEDRPSTAATNSKPSSKIPRSAGMPNPTQQTIQVLKDAREILCNGRKSNANTVPKPTGACTLVLKDSSKEAKIILKTKPKNDSDIIKVQVEKVEGERSVITCARVKKAVLKEVEITKKRARKDCIIEFADGPTNHKKPTDKLLQAMKKGDTICVTLSDFAKKLSLWRQRERRPAVLVGSSRNRRAG